MNLPCRYYRSLDGRTLVTIDDARVNPAGLAARLRVHSGPGDVDLDEHDIRALRDWLDSLIASHNAQTPKR